MPKGTGKVRGPYSGSSLKRVPVQKVTKVPRGSKGN
jgi:hypothetical protein